MNELITVVVPIYNVSQYLEKCISSLSEQTYSNIEILLIDDGSKDDSPGICDRWAQMDQRVRAIHKKNGGLSDARNTGLNEAKGSWITFVDGDDWLDPYTCEKALTCALEYNADIVMWPYVREFPDKIKPKHLFDADRLFEGDEVKNYLARRMAGAMGTELQKPAEADCIVTACAKLYRTSILCDNELKFVDHKIIGTHEDGLFNLEAFCYAEKVFYVNQYWYHYRKSIPGQLTRSYRENLYEQYQVLLTLLEEKGKSLGIRDIEEAVRNRVSLSLIPLTRNICRAPISMKIKSNEIRKILDNPKYADSLRALDTHGMQPHWKLFFTCCKQKLSFVVAVLAEITLRL